MDTTYPRLAEYFLGMLNTHTSPKPSFIHFLPKYLDVVLVILVYMIF